MLPTTWASRSYCLTFSGAFMAPSIGAPRGGAPPSALHGLKRLGRSALATAQQSDYLVWLARLDQEVIEADLFRDQAVRRFLPHSGDRDHERPADVGERIANRLGNGVAAYAGQADVDDDGVWPEEAQCRQHVLPSIGSTYHVTFVSEYQREAIGSVVLVVRYQDAQRRTIASSFGSRGCVHLANSPRKRYPPTIPSQHHASSDRTGPLRDHAVAGELQPCPGLLHICRSISSAG